MNVKKIAAALAFFGIAATSAHADICTIAPGSVTCGKGKVSSLNGNGIVSVHGTVVEGPAIINGLLKAEDANFSTLHVNGSVNLSHCVVNSEADIKGALKSSSSRFEESASIYSNSTQFFNTKIKKNLHIRHTDSGRQEVYLDNNSEIGGDVIFDDGNGEIYLKGNSKVVGNVTGGKIVNR